LIQEENPINILGDSSKFAIGIQDKNSGEYISTDNFFEIFLINKNLLENTQKNQKLILESCIHSSKY
jgi:hypothetical protein